MKIQPKKRFGQHFLTDQKVIDQIIDEFNPQKNELIVEIGPGLGSLTKEILPLVDTLHVIEIDKTLIPKLQNSCKKLGDLKIHCCDVLNFDFASLVSENQKLRIIGNLPYNISTPLLFHLMKYLPIIKDMHFMLQKEVARRLAANPGNSDYGRLGIMIQYYCKVYELFLVEPSSFTPEPKVDSEFIKLIPHETILFQAKNMGLFSEVVKQAFTYRRKTLRNALKALVPSEKLIELKIDPNLRPEQITIEQYVKIANGI